MIGISGALTYKQVFLKFSAVKDFDMPMYGLMCLVLPAVKEAPPKNELSTTGPSPNITGPNGKCCG